MGRRSRKQRPAAGAVAPEPPAPARRSTSRRSRLDRMVERAEQRPKPPWHPVPLVELAVLMGIVLIVIGFVEADSPRGRVALVFGMALSSLAGLETAAREHFTGYRSHSALLAGVPAIATAAAVFFAEGPYAAALAGAAAVFALAFWRLRAAFRNRAGVAFKV